MSINLTRACFGRSASRWSIHRTTTFRDARAANLQAYPELDGVRSIWIEIVPLTPGLRFWAMVSVTNNATQQVAIVTPHHNHL